MVSLTKGKILNKLIIDISSIFCYTIYMKKLNIEKLIKESKILNNSKNSAELLVRATALLYNRAEKIMEIFFSTFGITTAQYNVLILLEQESGGINPLTISQRMLVSQGNITRILDKLVNAGFIQRAEDKQDRRQKCISLTAKGRALCKKIQPEYDKFIQRLSKPFTAKEQKYATYMFVKWMYFLKEFSL